MRACTLQGLPTYSFSCFIVRSKQSCQQDDLDPTSCLCACQVPTVLTGHMPARACAFPPGLLCHSSGTIQGETIQWDWVLKEIIST